MAFMNRSTPKNSFVLVAEVSITGADRLKGLIHLLLKRVAGRGRQWKRISCCSKWLNAAPPAADRLIAPIQTTLFRVEWSGRLWIVGKRPKHNRKTAITYEEKVNMFADTLFLRNAVIYLRVHTASQPRRTTSSSNSHIYEAGFNI
jgi:hypothetical protein